MSTKVPTACLALAGLLTTATAHAAPTSAEREPVKNEDLAITLPLVTTIASVAAFAWGEQHNENAAVGLGMVGIALGPSLGSWYAGASGWRGLALRGGAVGGALIGFVMVMSDFCWDCETPPSDHVIADAGLGVLALSAGVFATGVVVGILDGKRDAHEANQRAWSIAPTMVTAPGAHTPSPGVGLSFRF